MTTTINASTSNGLVQTADGSGIIKVQSNGVTTNALAWANFYYTGSAVSVRASYNVSSVTRSATGAYTVNFSTSTTDANYSVSINYPPNYGTAYCGAAQLFANSSNTEVAPTTSAFSFNVYQGNAVAFDAKYICVSVFGN